MGWRRELSKPIDSRREIIAAPVVRILGPVEAGLDDPYEIEDFEPNIERDVNRALQSLTPREERILRLRFGFGCEGHSLADVGELFCITVERVRQIEHRALRKLKHPSRSCFIKDYIDGETRKLVPFKIRREDRRLSQVRREVRTPLRLPPPLSEKVLPDWKSAIIELEGVPTLVTIERWIACFLNYDKPGPHATFQHEGLEWVASLSELQPVT
jgi:DNA-binding CsgD family transcriptional regulator